MMNKELFKRLDEVIMDARGYLNPADFFRLISEYQLSRINDIENFHNTQQAQALRRTALYDNLLLNKFKKSSEKQKEKLVFKLVNLLCISNPSLKAIEMACDHDKEIFEIVCNYQEKILGNKEWYLGVIPESAWLITHFESTNKE